ncbi:LUD domain-containing protein [Apibacter sp. HY039]|uniref:LutC/YkgG family protein n=1 Tax=Apibacter sp. HY039 TaxID=2501476 RepID=UPI000FEC0C62|nr:LUD domain-containing protein [Apibacter sp. HY039]
MSSKEYILQNIKRNIKTRLDKPKMDVLGIQFDNLLLQFVDICKAVGGDARILEKQDDVNRLIKELYPQAQSIGSNLPEITISTFNPDDLDDPHLLNGTDLAIIKGEVGVAENGCIWIPQNVVHKALYFISEYLVIILDRTKLVNNMHEAYRTIESNDSGFGIFISGPSKTADIEQALVVGAHGPKGLTVILI